MEYIVNKKYPEIKVEKKNIYYARLLQNIYAGVSGEITTFMLYNYQSLEKYDIDNEYSNIIRQLAEVELIHVNILGKLINLLGMQPVYCYVPDNTNVFVNWNGSYINYNGDLNNMIKTNIQLEMDNINQYLNATSCIKDKYVLENIYRIIDNKERHLELFNKLLQNYSDKWDKK